MSTKKTPPISADQPVARAAGTPDVRPPRPPAYATAAGPIDDYGSEAGPWTHGVQLGQASEAPGGQKAAQVIGACDDSAFGQAPSDLRLLETEIFIRGTDLTLAEDPNELLAKEIVLAVARSDATHTLRWTPDDAQAIRALYNVARPHRIDIALLARTSVDRWNPDNHALIQACANRMGSHSLRPERLARQLDAFLHRAQSYWGATNGFVVCPVGERDGVPVQVAFDTCISGEEVASLVFWRPYGAMDWDATEAAVRAWVKHHRPAREPQFWDMPTAHQNFTSDSPPQHDLVIPEPVEGPIRLREP